MEPAVPIVASPVVSEISPDEPSDVVPVSNVSAPLTPLIPPPPVRIENAPEDVARPQPDVSETAPPMRQRADAQDDAQQQQRGVGAVPANDVGPDGEWHLVMELAEGGELFERLLALIDSGVAWNHASLQNSGAEVVLSNEEDSKLPTGIFRGGFYFTRCYAITREAMQNALKVGITKAHVDVALAVANWGKGFVIRPAAVLDVPSVSDNDWAEGGWAPWLAGQMQGVTHLPCVVSDRWKTGLLPKIVAQPKLEATAWQKFMEEAGAKEHLREGYGPGGGASARSPVTGSPKSWRRRLYDRSDRKSVV